MVIFRNLVKSAIFVGSCETSQIKNCQNGGVEDILTSERKIF